MDCFPNKKKKKGLHEKDLRGLLVGRASPHICSDLARFRFNLRDYDKNNLRGLAEKIVVLQLEVNDMLCEREKESRAFKKEVMAFACKEAEWQEERKRHEAEVKKLRKMVEEKQEIVQEIEARHQKSGKNGAMMDNCSGSFSTTRDETVEKWKQLYLDVKIVLDHLIERTHGDTLYWRSQEESIMEELNGELKDKEDSIQALKAQLDTMKRKQRRSITEVDILRQSLRIVSNQKKLHFDRKSIDYMRNKTSRFQY